MTLKFIHSQLHTPRSRPLSRPQSSQAFIHATYSTPGTRFLVLLYHPPPPFTLQSFQKPLQLFPRFFNLPLILPNSSSSCSTPLPLLALSLLLAFSIPTLSFLLITLSAISSILSSISLSLPTVQGLATPLFPNPTHLLHNLHQHLRHLAPAPFLFPSALSSLSRFLLILRPLFLIHQPLPPHPRHSPFFPHFHPPSSQFHIQSHAYRSIVRQLPFVSRPHPSHHPLSLSPSHQKPI